MSSRQCHSIRGGSFPVNNPPGWDPVYATVGNFLLALLGGRGGGGVNNFIHNCNTQGVKQVGIGIPDPTQTAPANFKTSEYCCKVLITSLINM